ncbi:MAG TPA: hypothetical protein VL442_16570 [Mucilaginibacter sp.]|nr:hypothetical protein [Mucilaginibacter sp.]
MKIFSFRQNIGLSLVCAMLLLSACSHPNSNSGSGDSRLQGNWKLKDGDTKLKITRKKFAMDADLEYAEDYFVKGDTIYSSFQGNQPYSKFVIQKLDDHNLKLLSPDSTVMEFTK